MSMCPVSRRVPSALFRTGALLAFALLAGCSSAPVPDVAYYVMPAPAAVTPRATPAFESPIVVDGFQADGLHGEQAILYATKPGGSLKAYHYQLWNDPPSRLVQRRLMKRLRDENVSALVADRLASGLSAIHVSGYIERFERISTGADAWAADVSIEVRVDTAGDDLPLLLKSYAAREPAENGTINATVRAFARALDTALEQFAQDLVQVEQ
jgi:cholesterol transport system auxiliary component